MKNPLVSTLDINRDTPADSTFLPGGQRAPRPEASDDGDALASPPPGRELPSIPRQLEQQAVNHIVDANKMVAEPPPAVTPAEPVSKPYTLPKPPNPKPKRYGCDVCHVEFVVWFGNHRETCPCCDNFCDQVKE